MLHGIGGVCSQFVLDFELLTEPLILCDGSLKFVGRLFAFVRVPIKVEIVALKICWIFE
jgi:hypothetical protein